MEDWEKGYIDWFDNARGIGVLEAQDGSRYTFHYSSIMADGDWKEVSEKQRVKFRKSGGYKRPIVTAIRPAKTRSK